MSPPIDSHGPTDEHTRIWSGPHWSRCGEVVRWHGSVDSKLIQTWHRMVRCEGLGRAHKTAHPPAIDIGVRGWGDDITRPSCGGPKAPERDGVVCRGREGEGGRARESEGGRGGGLGGGWNDLVRSEIIPTVAYHLEGDVLGRLSPAGLVGGDVRPSRHEPKRDCLARQLLARGERLGPHNHR